MMTVRTADDRTKAEERHPADTAEKGLQTAYAMQRLMINDTNMGCTGQLLMEYGMVQASGFEPEQTAWKAVILTS